MLEQRIPAATSLVTAPVRQSRGRPNLKVVTATHVLLLEGEPTLEQLYDLLDAVPQKGRLFPTNYHAARLTSLQKKGFVASLSDTIKMIADGTYDRQLSDWVRRGLLQHRAIGHATTLYRAVTTLFMRGEQPDRGKIIARLRDALGSES